MGIWKIEEDSGGGEGGRKKEEVKNVSVEA